MIISVVNHSGGRLGDEEVQAALRAINRQIESDFAPYWSLSATLRLEGKTGPKPRPQETADLRGDAILYLWDKSDVRGALGYHDRSAPGIPYGFVFLEVVKSVGESWTVTLSHEALELIGDPEVNLLVMGPHPVQRRRTVFHWYEMCDAVQAESYSIDHVEVSNFVLPLYFTGGEELGGRNDFLGRVHGGKTLRSFGVNPGGYIGFFDPEKRDHDTYVPPDDETARKRLSAKLAAKETRRAVRYRRFSRPPAAKK